jgi:serine/threonine-protein kinase
LAGRFRILDCIGEGGMGCVFAAEDVLVRSLVAIKAIRPEIALDEGHRLRFLRELRTARMVTHPNVCRLHDVAEAEVAGRTLLFLTMELLTGETLAERLRRQPRMGFAEVRSVAFQLCEALAALHAAGIVHRDLKPGNIMLSERSGGLQAIVMDFGLAQAVEALPMPEQITRTGQISGTPAYMAPEQATGGTVTPASDVYSLGIVIAQMSAGLELHSLLDRTGVGARLTAAGVAAMREQDRSMAAVVARCLQTEPGRRYPSTTVLSQAMQARFPAKQWAAAAVLVVALALVGVVGNRMGVLGTGLGRELPANRRVAILPLRQTGGNPLPPGTLDGLSLKLSQSLSACCSGKNAWFAAGADISRLGTNPARKLADALGVNLVVSGTVVEKNGTVLIGFSVEDARSAGVLRSTHLSLPAENTVLSGAAVTSKVADLLDLNPRSPGMVSPSPESVAPGVQQYRQRALGYRARRDAESYTAATALLQKALEADPEYGLAWADLALTQLLRYELFKDPALLAQAEQSVEKAHRFAGESPQTLRAQALVDFNHGNFDQAVQLLKQALAAMPGDAEILTALAGCYGKLGQNLWAQQTYFQALEANPGDWTIYYKLGGFFHQVSQEAEAEKYDRMAYDLAPDSVVAIGNLGGELIFRRKYAEAITVLTRGIQIRKTASLYNNLGTAYYQIHQGREAVEAFQEAGKLAPTQNVVQRNLGDALLLTGDAAKAQEAYARALALLEAQIAKAPGDPELVGRRAVYLAKCGRTAEARRQVADAVRRFPNNDGLLFQCAVARALCSDSKEAIALLAGALAKGFSYSEAQATPELDGLRKDPRYPQNSAPNR